MRLLHVAHSFVTERHGGVENFLADLLRAQQAQGHALAVYHGRDRRQGRHATVLDGAWGELRRRRVTRASPPGGAWARFAARFRDRAVEGDFARFLAEWRPDVVHVHHTLNLSGRVLPLARAAGAGVVLTLHDHWFTCARLHRLHEPDGRPCAGSRRGGRCAACHDRRGARGFARTLVRLWPMLHRQARHRRWVEAAHVVTIPARFQEDVLREAGLRPARLVHVPYGLDLRRAVPPGRRRRDAGPLRVAYLGALAPHKGLELLAAAAARLPPRGFEFQLWGAEPRGDHRAWWQGFKAALPRPPFVLCGGVFPDEVGLALQDADLLVIPSRWEETGPLVVQEACAAGVPVLAARHGGMAEWLQDGTSGLLFAPGDAEALRTTLRDVQGDRAYLDRLARQAPPPVPIEETARRFAALYEEARAAAGGRAVPLPGSHAVSA